MRLKGGILLVALPLALSLAGCGGRVGDDQTGSGPSKATAAPDDAPSVAVPRGAGGVGGSPSGTDEAPATSRPASIRCNTTPTIATGFENGLDSSWPVTGSSYLQADSASPIAGRRSLLVTLSSAFEHPYFTVPLRSACRITLTFTIRADSKILSTGPTSVARIAAGSTAWFHVQINPGGTMMLASEVKTDIAAGIGFPGSFGALQPDTPTVITATVDYGAKTASAALAPVGTPMPKPTPGIFRIDERNPNNPGPIMGVDIGAAPGFVGSSSGLYWLDDLTIE